MSDPITPSLPAWRLGDDLAVWCPHCSRYHWHGAPAGHRAAHCRDDASPFAATGYDLAEIGAAPPLLISDANHRRPLGPAALGLMESGR